MSVHIENSILDMNAIYIYIYAIYSDIYARFVSLFSYMRKAIRIYRNDTPWQQKTAGVCSEVRPLQNATSVQ